MYSLNTVHWGNQIRGRDIGESRLAKLARALTPQTDTPSLAAAPSAETGHRRRKVQTCGPSGF